MGNLRKFIPRPASLATLHPVAVAPSVVKFRLAEHMEAGDSASLHEPATTELVSCWTLDSLGMYLAG